MDASPRRVIAFAGTECVAQGSLSHVALATKRLLDARDPRPILIFDAATSEPVEIDFRGHMSELVARLSRADAPRNDQPEADTDSPSQGSRGPGRPRLGVVGKEVTLLPRHWEWLASQPGGASVTLRKLVEAARRENAEADRVRQARDAAYRFMLAMAGNEPGFEEAARALYAGREAPFNALVERWPPNVRDHARALASVAAAVEPA
jgi:hypothetical protein